MSGFSGFLSGARLQPKVIWSIAAVFILINMGISVAIGLFSSQSMKKQLESHYSKVAEARAGILVEPVWIFEYSRAQKLLDELVVDRNILEAKIEVDRESFRATGNTAQNRSTETVEFPIVYKDDTLTAPLGKFTMTFSTGTASGIINRRIFEGLLLSLMLVLVVAFFMSRYGRRNDGGSATV